MYQEHFQLKTQPFSEHASATSLCLEFAKLLGRKGGVSGLSTEEMECLSQFHRHHPRITSRLLEEAFEQAEVKTIPVIVFHLQLLHERNP